MRSAPSTLLQSQSTAATVTNYTGLSFFVVMAFALSRVSSSSQSCVSIYCWREAAKVGLQKLSLTLLSQRRAVRFHFSGVIVQKASSYLDSKVLFWNFFWNKSLTRKGQSNWGMGCQKGDTCCPPTYSPLERKHQGRRLELH